MTRQIRRFCAAIAITGLLAGCGLANPYASTTQTKTRVSHPTSTAVDRDPAPERGGTIPATATRAQHQLALSAGQPTRRSALARYAWLYMNWTASDVAARETELAAISLGSARAQARQAAASYRGDSTLLKSDVANTGTVVAITKGEGLAAGDWMLVTRETTTGKGDYQGLPAQLHVTYAQLTKTPTGWVISSWAPQS
jgi:hypothetical protein